MGRENLGFMMIKNPKVCDNSNIQISSQKKNKIIGVGCDWHDIVYLIPYVRKQLKHVGLVRIKAILLKTEPTA